MCEPNYFAIISADVRYDKTLSSSEKLLYAEITSLCNKTGVCFASNKYFADLFGVSIRTIQNWLKNLIEKRYLNTELIYKEGSKEVDKRYLSVVKNNSLPPVKETSRPSETDFVDNKYNTNKDIIITNKDKDIENFIANLKEDWYLILKDWIEYRSSIKRPLKTVSYIPCYEKLVKMSGDDIVIAQKIVEQSKANGWQGLFPIKEKKEFTRKSNSYRDKGEQAMNNIRSMFEEGMKERW